MSFVLPHDAVHPEETTGSVPPTPIPLRTMRDVQVELACVYNQARRGEIEMKDATGLAHILQCVTKTIELRASDEVLERLDKLEAKVAQ